MSVSIQQLSVNPRHLRRGDNNVRVSFSGYVTQSKDNPVMLTFSVASDDANVFILNEDGLQVKQYSWSQDLPGIEAELFRPLVIRIIDVNISPYYCPVGLHVISADRHSTDYAPGSILYS